MMKSLVPLQLLKVIEKALVLIHLSKSDQINTIIITQTNIRLG